MSDETTVMEDTTSAAIVRLADMLADERVQKSEWRAQYERVQYETGDASRRRGHDEGMEQAANMVDKIVAFLEKNGYVECSLLVNLAACAIDTGLQKDVKRELLERAAKLETPTATATPNPPASVSAPSSPS